MSGKYYWDKTVFKENDVSKEPEEFIISKEKTYEERLLKFTDGLGQMYVNDDDNINHEEDEKNEE